MHNIVLLLAYLCGAGHGQEEQDSTERRQNCPSAEILRPVAAYDTSLAKSGVIVSRGAFTPEECKHIIELLKTRCMPEHDVRQAESVSRVNYWEPAEGTRGKGKTSSGDFDWIYDRLIEMVNRSGVPTTGDGALVEWGFDVTANNRSALAAEHVEFVLMHEFKGEDYFDWHIDTNPSDGTARTINVNIMLSEQSSVYQGGNLLVGKSNCHAEVGDLYWYPAAYPHKVDDIKGGVRHSLILAMKAKSDSVREASDYFVRADQNFRSLVSNRTEVESKWHLLYGNYLLDSKPAAEGLADDQFAASYASTPQAAQYAQHFNEQGQEYVKMGFLEEALKLLRFAVKVGGRDSGGGRYQKHVEQVEQVLKDRAQSKQE